MISDEASARAFVAQWAGADAVDRLERLLTCLAEENTRQNLVAAATLPVAWQRHVADSAQLLSHVPRETLAGDAGPWLDLGSGAGFPGLVLAVLRPQDHVAGLDPQLERAIVEALRLLREHPPERPAFEPRPRLALPELPRDA